MAVNTRFLKGSLLSSSSLPCHLWKLSQHSWESARWMTSASDVICSPPGWNAVPGCCVTAREATLPKEAVTGLPLGRLSSKGGWFNRAQCPELSILWAFYHNWLLSLYLLLYSLWWNLQNFCNPNCQVAEHIKSENLYKPLGLFITLKAAHETSISSGRISQSK